MGIRKNQAGQRLLVFAFTRATNAPVLGDAANITAKLRLDSGTATDTNDVNPTELEDGYYEFSVTQAETNANVIDVFPESSTAGTQVIGVPTRIFTSPSSLVANLGLALASRDNLESMFGADNVYKWADLDNEEDDAVVDARIEQALAFGTADFNELMRGGPMLIPITDDPPLGAVDTVTRLSGVWLYENRGVNDVTDEKDGKHRLSYHKKRAYMWIREVHAGKRRLGVTDEARSYPAVVLD